MASLADKVAVVTGAAAGIGAATARALAAAGARVALIDREAAGAAAVAKEIPGARAYGADVSDKNAVETTFAAIGADFGGIDILVNNAGIESVWTIERMPEAEWDRVLAVNLKGAMLCTQAAVAPMRARGGGAIVNVASVAGKLISFSGGASYTASKAGMLGFTRHAAFELGIDRIRVNAVCPGPTLTPMIRRNLDDAQQRAVEKRVPLGRWIRPEDIANAVVFLAGDGAAMCTGTSIDVDGGVLVSNGSPYEEYFARRR
ncbi:MAG: SDR family oxidoreductase [Rhodospirillaceae bacterium]|nr:SDR family oxidoreductase [Rhodospirillaceae bacterium]